jgi:hypothetical protein
MNRRLRSLIVPALIAGLGACESIDKFGEILGNSKVSMKLKNGQKIEGTLLQKEDGSSTVQLTYGTVTVTSGDVASVETSEPGPKPSVGTGRLAKWDHCLHSLVASRASAALITPIAATVIDKGIFRNVPYLSHRSGDWEFNVYGDPDEPAGLELGITSRTPGLDARRHCLRVIAEFLNDPEDRTLLASLNLDRAKVERRGMIFEVTPATDEDAYGSWWISIYSVPLLEQQRASEKELARITTGRGQPAAAPAGGDVLRWKEHELKMARPDADGGQQGRVFLRGIHRKNGVYVALAKL